MSKDVIQRIVALECVQKTNLPEPEPGWCCSKKRLSISTVTLVGGQILHATRCQTVRLQCILMTN
jgi:hypothetical protein